MNFICNYDDHEREKESTFYFWLRLINFYLTYLSASSARQGNHTKYEMIYTETGVSRSPNADDSLSERWQKKSAAAADNIFLLAADDDDDDAKLAKLTRHQQQQQELVMSHLWQTHSQSQQHKIDDNLSRVMAKL